MSMFICNAFNDPNDPWYYVIGVLFLLLVFGALALYLFLSKRKADKNGGEAVEMLQPADNEKNDEVKDGETLTDVSTNSGAQEKIEKSE